MTATVGVTFGAGSAAKRILLFAINVTVLLLGLTCSVLCLYQVKLMPETYEVIVAAIQESNLTTPEPVTLPPVTVPKNSNSNNDRNTTRTTKKGRPRVSRYVGPKNGSSRNPKIPPFPVTTVENFGDSAETGTAVTSSFGMLDTTKPLTLSQTITTTSTISSTMAKASTSSSSLSTRIGTPTPLKNSSNNEILDFGQVLKDRIAQLESELRLAQFQQRLPIVEINFPNTQTSWTMSGTTTALTSRSSVLTTESIPTTHSQLSVQQSITNLTSINAKSTAGLESLLLSTPSSVFLASLTPTVDGLSSASSQTSVATTTSTPKLIEKSTVTSSTTEWPTTSTALPTVMSTTTTAVTKSTTTPTTSVTNIQETSVLSSTTLISSMTEAEGPLVTSTPTTLLVKISTSSSLDPTTISAFTPSIPPSVIHQSVDSTQTKAQDTTLTEISSSSPSIEATTALMTSTKDMPTTLAHTTASFTSSPTTTGSVSTSSVTTQKATTLMATTTSRPVSTTSATTISLASSTRKLNTSSTTPSSVGFINLTNVIDSISKLVGRRDLSARMLRKRSPATTVAPVVISSSDTLTADHIPIYFEQVFFLVQTSLYVCTAAGLLIFFSSLVGICGGLFRIDGCLKFSVAALVLVIMAEMATTAFIFVAHDKASNRNKNKNFDRDLKLLCDLANFCVQPMLLVITGSFLCVSVVLQIGSITLACNLMDNRTESDPDKKLRRMMRSGGADFQFGSGNMYNNPYTNPMPMPMPRCCGGGGGYGGMGGNHFSYPSSMMMPMQNMYPPVFTGPGQRPIVNIIS